jgi:hypothetical protein
MLSVNDDSANSPQTLSVTGTGTGSSPLSIGEAPGSSTSATVTAGATAIYNLSLLSGGGFAGPVALTCNGAPANSTCTVDPASLSVTAGGSATFKVTVATNVSQSSRIAAAGRIMLSGLAALSLFILPFVSRGRRRAFGSLAFFLVISTGLTLGCGGGNSGGSATSPPSGSSAVTPPGKYTLTVQAVSGKVTATQALTLIVQ